ncbi:MAG: hypothetical protein NT007_03840 [Candidatus Kapabacteria bacterium]|nr:hypothetical protein [Candidatus Kapabacteria bacterium]
MSNKFQEIYLDINKILLSGVNILNISSTLKSISMDLKLLAINGIVQAAKIGTKQGQSLIALSAFLSDLPLTIAPELEDLERQSIKMSKSIIGISINIRKLLVKNKIIHKIDSINSGNFLNGNAYELNSIGGLMEIKRRAANVPFIDDNLKTSIDSIVESSIINIEEIYLFLNEISLDIVKLKNKIDRIRRNGFIANYMGSNISIESSYLVGGKSSFNSLVSNIKKIVDKLNNSLDSIIDMLAHSENILNNVKHSNLIK